MRLEAIHFAANYSFVGTPRLEFENHLSGLSYNGHQPEVKDKDDGVRLVKSRGLLFVPCAAVDIALEQGPQVPITEVISRAFAGLGIQECAGDDLGDWHLRPLLKRNIYGRTGDKQQAARLDEARAVVLPLYRRMVRAVLEVLRETEGQSDKVTLEFQSRGSHEGGIRGEMYRLEPHDHGEPVSRNLSADGKELSRPVLVGALPNLEEGV